LSIILVDCFALIQPEIELIGHLRGALLCTGSARRAFRIVNVSSFPVDLGLKVTDLAREFSYLAISQQVNVRMPTDIQQLRRENSYSAVIGGKSLVQLGHFAADAGVLFHQVDFDAHVAKIQSGLHPGYSTANDENFL